MSESKKERVVVKKWDAVVFWKFGGKMDCAICRNDIMVPCIACEAEPDSEECSRAVGQCGHSFHLHCISKWLQSRATCPLDDTNWEYAKYEQQGSSKGGEATSN
mmetsp:Transcript_26523/g.36962  ORF Transcript_26523/g.36962 Transcript_26523/m.36962 type:complete len:104 (+) Transcript_26523:117-428(+)